MMWRIHPRKSLSALCLGTLVLATLCAFFGFHFSPAHAAAYSVRFAKNIAYGPQPYEVYDQCTPVGAPPLRPGIIMIHGGGWSGGYKARYDSACKQYAAEGYVATTIDYRLAPQYQWPDQIGDVQLAVRYMRVNAHQTGLDPNRICSLGDSAGAQLALLLDEMQTIHSADVAQLYPTISPTVHCVVDQFGPSDLALLYQEVPAGQKYLYNYLGYTPQADPTVYTDASPVDNISTQSGQVLIIQGTRDTHVLPDQSQELQRDLQNAGIAVQYISYNGDHEYLYLSKQQITAIMAQINSFLVSVD